MREPGVPPLNDGGSSSNRTVSRSVASLTYCVKDATVLGVVTRPVEAAVDEVL